MPETATPAKRVTIVTGATSGMGIDIAKRLHATGYRVAIVGRNALAGGDLETEIGDPKNALFFPADVSNYDDQAAMFRHVWATWDRIDVLCANAGIVDQSSIYIYDWREKPVWEVPPAPNLQCTDTDLKGCVINFVRGMAPMLKDKENILINAVMPGAVDTPIVPPEMTAAVSKECLTPIATVVKAHELFLNDDTRMAGKTLEASVEKLIYYDMPEMGNGKATKRAVTVWEPLFRAMHGESSNMPDDLL